MTMRQRYPKEAGFTLIEMIVSLAVFAFVVTISVGALLVLISSNQRLQGEQNVMTNLSFILDSMTREIRTGYAYFCAGVMQDNSPVAGGDTKIFSADEHENLSESDENECVSGNGAGSNGATFHGLSFYEGGNSITTGGNENRILYYLDRSSTPYQLMRRISNRPAQVITSSDIEIVDLRFFVTGTANLRDAGDTEQPTVTIFIEARKVGEDKAYQLQTTVTQRVLDL